MHIGTAVRLSNKGRYAVRALFDIAYFNQGQATQAKDIAERQSIPPRFLEQIFQDLKRAGIVASKRGPQGGYSLAGEADSIRLGDVIRALEGPLVLSDGSEPGEGEVVNVTEAVFRDLSERVESCFDGVTLADICARAQTMGVPRGPKESYSYVI
jgi:Rrf2 family transcriptional regulator, iron-sulfur cluster assembly transcription factor